VFLRTVEIACVHYICTKTVIRTGFYKSDFGVAKPYNPVSVLLLVNFCVRFRLNMASVIFVFPRAANAIRHSANARMAVPV